MKERTLKEQLLKNQINVKDHSVEIYVDNWTKDKNIIFSELPEEVQKSISFITAGYSNSKDNRLNISRADIFGEENLLYRFIKVLMFGYPKAEVSHFDKKGSQSSMHKILSSYPDLKLSLSNLLNKNFDTVEDFIEDSSVITLWKTNGLGLSTFSKFLYLFGVTFKESPCVIIDSRVKKSFEFYEETSSIAKIQILGSKDEETLKAYLKILEALQEISYNYNIAIDLLEYILFNTRA